MGAVPTFKGKKSTAPACVTHMDPGSGELEGRSGVSKAMWGPGTGVSAVHTTFLGHSGLRLPSRRPLVQRSWQLL